jgi:hypothetical protein
VNVFTLRWTHLGFQKKNNVNVKYATSVRHRYNSSSIWIFISDQKKKRTRKRI